MPYTTTPRLRLCYQIVGTTMVSGSNNMRQMCSCCQSEGGFFPLGKKNSIHTTTSGVTLTSLSSNYIVLALRINSSYPDGILKLIGMSLLFSATVSKVCVYTIQLHSTYAYSGTIGSISASLTYTNFVDSIAQYSIGTGQTISTNGFILSSGFINGQSSVTFTNSDYETLLKRVPITQYDTLYITAQSTSNSEVVYCAIDFIESL